MKKNAFTLMGIVVIVFTLLTGCSSKNTTAKEPSIDEIDQNIKEAVDISNMVESDSDKLEKLYDIDIEEVEDFKLYTAKTNIEANELLLLKVKEEKDIEDIKEDIKDRIETQSSSFKDYLPDEYYLIEKNILKSNGNYIIFVISEEAEKIENIFDESFK
ncbi:DUF4358 domain-containing protein [Anaerosalibacter sp. Marseille-P3206]|uniref:DUF4358 domain-containing protein n=1 Tax=Anaerosalibacter sp. Marseille-P3206 TaxID=1871005 RepID=UPI000986C20E|nr:DUF4358 domain-containing protein [Anaerosalibacter sp. Marseille-P3206]